MRRCFALAPAVLTAGLLAQEAPVVFEMLPAATTGMTWRHDNARSPERFLPETHGPGVAILDYDGDGMMDVFLVNSGPADFSSPSHLRRHALYRNLGGHRFADVTAEAGIGPGAGFGMGAAAADCDNDGDTDLLVTAYGRAQLYRNTGSGRFVDDTARAGLDRVTALRDGWTTSAAWFDSDGDRHLDLFVGRFVSYSREIQRSVPCDTDGRPVYCVPRVFGATASVLLRNRGDGTFEDVSARSVIGATLGKALGVVAADVNGDGRMDLFVANDTEPNFLFLNLGGGRWVEVGFEARVALSGNGMPRSGMGVDAADLDDDGRPELFVANLDREGSSLYRNDGDGGFTDVAIEGDLGSSTFLMSGWGLRFFDMDVDGDLDLLLANGHPDDRVDDRGGLVRYEEPLLAFLNDAGRLRDVSRQAGEAFARSWAARGLATGDLDNDGRVDVVVGVNGGTPLVLRNRSGAGAHWVGVRLVGRAANRDGVGARVRWVAGRRVRTRSLAAGGSYLSSHDPRLVLGLGTAPRADWVEVQWPAPSRRTERFRHVATDRYSTLVEGRGEPVDPRGTNETLPINGRPVGATGAQAAPRRR